jgi:formate dehydrogenase iron-sulfur subunit
MPHHPIAQPQESAPLLSPEQQDALTHCLARFGQEPGGLLPLLHSLQDRLGFIPRAAVPAIAEALNLSRAEVHGVVSYYPHLREQPHGRTLIQICRAEACKSRGGDALFAHAQETLGCQAHGTSADGSVTLEPVYCLGLCAQSPAVMVDESEVHARMTADRLDALLEEIQQKQLETKADEAQASYRK